MDHISAVISRYNGASGARLVAGCDDTDVAATCEPPPAPPATGPIPPDAILGKLSELSLGFDKLFNDAVDRVLARARAAAKADADAARLRYPATQALGIATLAARRATSHGGRASQARSDDSDPAAASDMTRSAGVSHWNQAELTSMSSAFCVAQNHRLMVARRDR